MELFKKYKELFKTYKEAVIAVGSTKHIIQLKSPKRVAYGSVASRYDGFVASREEILKLEDEFGLPFHQIECTFCSPADYLEALESFLASGKRLLERDLYVELNGEVVKVHNAANANVRDDKDCNRFVLQAAADKTVDKDNDMGIYKTYKEAVIANGSTKGIFTTGECWNGLPHRKGKFSTRLGNPAIGINDWLKCKPSDHLHTLEEFLASGKRLVDGDLYVPIDGYVRTVGTDGEAVNLNRPWPDIDTRTHVLQAAADEHNDPIKEKQKIYKTYKEAVISNGSVKGIHCAMISNDGRDGVFGLEKDFSSITKNTLPCYPSGYLQTLADFLESGMSLTKGDLLINTMGQVCSVNHPSAMGMPVEMNKNRYVLDAMAYKSFYELARELDNEINQACEMGIDNTAKQVESLASRSEKPDYSKLSNKKLPPIFNVSSQREKEEHEEFDRLAREHDNEANQAHEMGVDTKPQQVEQLNGPNFKKGDPVVFERDDQKGLQYGVYMGLDDLKKGHIIRSSGDYFFSTSDDDLRKPETPAEREERERLEAAYDLYCVVADSDGGKPSKFEDWSSLKYAVKSFLAIVDKTGYRKD